MYIPIASYFIGELPLVVWTVPWRLARLNIISVACWNEKKKLGFHPCEQTYPMRDLLQWSIIISLPQSV